MKVFLRLVFFLNLSLFLTASSYSAHIIGGHISYEVIANSGSSFGVEVEVEIYRENLGGGAQFDQFIRVGLFRKESNNSYVHVNTSNVAIGIVDIDVLSLSDCELAISESQQASYMVYLDVPNDGKDYMIAYQRCCRTNNIINIENPQESGIALNVLITHDALLSMNKSHKILNSSTRFIQANIPSSIIIDLEGDNDVVSEIINPLTAGGTDGFGANSGDLNSCTGLTPDPLICPPPFANVDLQNNINEASLFFDSDEFTKLSEIEYNVIATVEGNYLFSYLIHEYKDSVLMSTHYREQVYVVSNCSVILSDEEKNVDNAVRIFPNPVKDLLHLEPNDEIDYRDISIMNINGREVLKIQNDRSKTIDVRNLLPGVYFLQIRKGKGIDQQKFIKS